MAITQAVCDSFKAELLEGLHDPSDDYKIALYTDSATLDASTTAYTTSGEVTGDGYTAGGVSLQGYTAGSGSGVAWIDWTTDPSWSDATITAAGALIYNATQTGDPALAVLDFGEDISSTADTFTVTMPAAGSSTAIIRIA